VTTFENVHDDDVAVPYYCARNNFTVAITDCMANPANINVTTLTDQTKKYASSGMIDDTSNMYNDRVYIFHGALDNRVHPGNYLISDFHGFTGWP